MHIVRDVATERDMRLERDLDGASCHSTVGGSSQAVSDDDNSARRSIRRTRGSWSGARRFAVTCGAPWHNCLTAIVTFKTHRRLVEAGELFHGVAPQRIKPTINEVAGEMGSRFTSQEQAVEHVGSLVDGLLAYHDTLRRRVRAHIYAEGTRWGLDPMDVEAIFREHVDRHRRRAARRSCNAGAGSSGSSAHADNRGHRHVARAVPVRPPAATTPVDSDPPSATGEVESVTVPSPQSVWWDDQLQTAVAHVRAAHPDLTAALERAQAADETQRGEAYAQVIAWCVQPPSEQADLADIQSLLTSWYTREPSDVAARRIPELLLAPARRTRAWLASRSPARVGGVLGLSYRRPHVEGPRTSPPRSTELAALLEAVVREPLDRGREVVQLENQCSRGARCAVTMRHSRTQLPRVLLKTHSSRTMTAG